MSSQQPPPPPPPPVTLVAVPLPPGWKEYKDGNGKAYYYDSQSQTTQWERPTVVTVNLPPPPPPPCPRSPVIDDDEVSGPLLHGRSQPEQEAIILDSASGDDESSITIVDGDKKDDGNDVDMDIAEQTTTSKVTGKRDGMKKFLWKTPPKKQRQQQLMGLMYGFLPFTTISVRILTQKLNASLVIQRCSFVSSPPI